MARIRVALVGYGNAGRFAHAPFYRESQAAQLTCIVEPYPGGAALARNEFPDAPVVATLTEARGVADFEAVDIATPPSYHLALIKESLAHSLHILCEKPVVLTRSECAVIAQLRVGRQAVVQGCHNWLKAPSIAHMSRLVANGLIGEPERFTFSLERLKAASGTEHFLPSWRNSRSHAGGILSDLGYHGIYLANHFLRGIPSTIDAHSKTSDGQEIEKDCVVALKNANGAKAVLDMSWTGTRRHTEICVHGDCGSVRVEGETLTLNTLEGERQETWPSLTADSWHPDWTSRVLHDFVENVRQANDRDPWNEITSTVAVMAGAYDLLRERGNVRGDSGE